MGRLDDIRRRDMIGSSMQPGCLVMVEVDTHWGRGQLSSQVSGRPVWWRQPRTNVRMRMRAMDGNDDDDDNGD